MEHAEWVNLQIKERFNEAGIEFAFPTQTIKIAQKYDDTSNRGSLETK
jgi:small-conductance mechanosensitive channel